MLCQQVSQTSGTVLSSLFAKLEDCGLKWWICGWQTPMKSYLEFCDFQLMFMSFWSYLYASAPKS